MKGLTPKKLIAIYSVLLGIIILASAGVIYILVVSNLLGWFDFFDDSTFRDLKPRVALLESEYSKGYLNTLRDKSFKDLNAVWRERLDDLEVTYETISDATLEKGLRDFDVLILSAAICLSNKERENIWNFLGEGKGVIATWAIGVRDENGEWRGWNFLEELAGIEVWGETREKKKGFGYFMFKGGEILSASIPSGLRVELQSYDSGILATSRHADACYTNWRLEPIHKPEIGSVYSAVSHNSIFGGRVVWYSFNIALPKRSPTVETAIRQLLQNSVRWTARHPVSGLANWPLNQQSAVVFSIDSEKNFADVSRAISLFQRNEIPATFFCVSSNADEYREITKRLAVVGEVASHGDVHEIFSGETMERQARRLGTSRESLVYITGEPVVGFRPPEEKFDKATIDALEREGFRYIAANFNTNNKLGRAVPDLIGSNGGLVLIPRIGFDDYWLVVMDQSTPPGTLLDALKNDFDRIHRLGGIYLINVHTHLFMGPKEIELLENIINYIKSKNSWIATSAEVAKWWRQRNGVRIKTDLVSWRRIALYVSSLHEEIVKDISVTVTLPNNPKSIVLGSELVNVSKPRYEVDTEGFMTIHITDLLPFENRTYWIDLTY